jgi:hypothetical protein
MYVQVVDIGHGIMASISEKEMILHSIHFWQNVGSLITIPYTTLLFFIFPKSDTKSTNIERVDNSTCITLSFSLQVKRQMRMTWG